MLKLLKFLIFIISVNCLLVSCYSYRVSPIAYRNLEQVEKPIQVYVLNPELSHELEILKKTNIYEIVDDSTISTKVKLYPMLIGVSDDWTFFVTTLFLGQVPAFMDKVFLYKYDLLDKDKLIKDYQFELWIRRRKWFWDIFSSKENKDLLTSIVQSIKGNYIDNNFYDEKYSLYFGGIYFY